MGVIFIGLLGILMAVILICDKSMGRRKAKKRKRRYGNNVQEYDHGRESAEYGRKSRKPEDGQWPDQDVDSDDKEYPDYDRELSADEYLDYDQEPGADEYLDYDLRAEADEILEYVQEPETGEFPEYVQEPETGEFPEYVPESETGELLEYVPESETGELLEYVQEPETGEFLGYVQESETGELLEYIQEPETGEFPEYDREPEADGSLEYAEVPNSDENPEYTEVTNSAEGMDYEGEAVFDTAPEEPEELPIIRVDHVTMKYKVATSSTSGLKDFLIQKIKKQITTRDLLALDEVSFDVYKGEIVGIIGTNGSGKSTLLKIVSGALKPTGGKVIVDQSKIQLLTLGAGFDTELSARENVYLNGAIIGYSREFIDQHYNEIVEFSELDGFMDEKVKNFSSGMVSRLGFAIATAGDAAEILILDEVLSVGDEFFRKKSLARIKEMIHGGSTVLMVSHGMGTILSNCTKAVWIEKGRLQMAGDTKTVCEAYRKQFG